MARVTFLSIVISLAILVLCGSVAACVWYANEWIASTLATVTVLAWLGLWLVAVYRREQVQAMAAGALVAGGAYWLLALGPWFNVNLGPTLLTSRLLAWLSAPTAQNGQQLAVYTSYTPVSYTTGLPVQSGDVLLSGSGIVTTSPQIAWSYPSPQVPPALANASPRQNAGQWAFTWLFAVAGGGFAWLLAWRNAAADSRRNTPATQPPEDSP